MSFINYYINKDFVGKKSLQKQQAEGLKKKLVQMEVFGLQDRDTGPNEPIFDGEKLVGRARIRCLWTQS